MPTFTKTTDVAGYITVSEVFTVGDTVSITLFDVTGGVSLSLVSSVCTDVSGTFSWDFYNLPGNIITPGVYVYRMTNQAGIDRSGVVRILPIGGLVTPVYSTLTVQLYEYNALLGANTTNGIAAAYVSIYDSLGHTLIQKIQSNANGSVSFSLVDGSYLIRANKAGVSFVEETLTIVNATLSTPSQLVYGTLLGVPALTTTPSTCRIYEYCFDVNSTTILPTVSASAQIVDQVSNYFGRVHSVQSELGVYDSTTGEVYWDFVWGASVRFTISEVGIQKTITIPSVATQRLVDV